MILSGSGHTSEVSKIHQHGTRQGHMVFGEPTPQQVLQVASAMNESTGGRWAPSLSSLHAYHYTRLFSHSHCPTRAYTLAQTSHSLCWPYWEARENAT